MDDEKLPKIIPIKIPPTPWNSSIHEFNYIWTRDNQEVLNEYFGPEPKKEDKKRTEQGTLF